MWKYAGVVLSLALLTPLIAFGEDERVGRFEVEGGALGTRNMEIHGYEQESATKDWDSYDPTVRVEYWWVKSAGWNYGVIAQPLYAHYSDTLKNDLNYDGEIYKKGDHGTLGYQFHSVRGTANYPVLGSMAEHNYLRVGGSLIARYADVHFKTDHASFHDINFIGFPLFNLESELRLNDDYSFFTRGDFLPSIDGNIFLDGLFDLLFAVRAHTDSRASLDLGIRLFFGGYDPNKVDDYANRIFFNGVVLRYSW
ncbi:MAG: hypothetical protein EBZ48_14850 [Proteobacteria bacterium]|nr:hypothetical protein [Pseudomonadota bacterium]